jgi:hypothetical protein
MVPEGSSDAPPAGRRSELPTSTSAVVASPATARTASAGVPTCLRPSPPGPGRPNAHAKRSIDRLRKRQERARLAQLDAAAVPHDPGRKRRFCSDACKQAAYRARKRAREQARQRAQDDTRRQQREEQARRQRDRLAAPRRARRDQPPRPLLRDLRRPPRSPHHSPRPGRPRPRPAPLQRPTRQGRLDRVPRGSRRLPGQAEQLRAKYGLQVTTDGSSRAPRPSKASATVRPPRLPLMVRNTATRPPGAVI